MDFNISKEIINDKNYMSQYMRLLINRVTNATMSLERDLGDSNEAKNAVKLNDCMIAFDLLIDNFGNGLSEQLIIDVANRVNASEEYISNGYRKIGDFLADTSIPISDPDFIKRDIKRLLYKYNNTWSNLDYLKREALFHLEFIRIHPFEDGNGRTGRLLLNYNLLNNGKVPVIICLDDLEYYQKCIRDNDADGLTKLFYKQSILESKVINDLYDSYNEEVGRHRK